MENSIITPQKTLRNSFSLEGKGLHTGLPSQITFNPAPENYGYKICRTDVPGRPIIDAVAENVTSTNRGTVLSDNGTQVGTVEHALAALYGCGIDNCIIEINGPEFPIMDGSSIAYVSKIKEIGLKNQSAARKKISLKRKRIRVTDTETGSEILLLPGDSLRIQLTIKFDSLILKHQTACMDNISNFARDFACARTFVFVKELDGLLQDNLIKGGDLDNSIVIYDEPLEQEKLDRLSQLTGTRSRNTKSLGYIMNKPLVYENEPARHKLLDILGDLALSGVFIEGTIIAKCPGHKINTSFAKAVREQYLAGVNKKEKCFNSNILDANLALALKTI